MAHFLTTNWTEKIKTNPVANLILNNNKKPPKYRIRLQTLTHKPGPKKYATGAFLNKFLGPVGRDDIVTAEELEPITAVYPTRGEYMESYNSAIKAVLKEEAEKKVGDGDDDDDVVVASVGRPSGRDPALEPVHVGPLRVGGAKAGIGLARDSKAQDAEVARMKKSGIVVAKKSAIDNIDHKNFDDAVEYDSDDSAPEILDVDEINQNSMWDNVYVNDYIHIQHPKIRYDYINALAGKPLQIKPPSVFFSDV